MRKGLVLHPILFAIYPILFLYSKNTEELNLSFLLSSVLISLCLMFFLWIVGCMALRDYRKASVVVSSALILFFSYGHLYSVIADWKVFSFEIGRHRYLIILWAGIFLSICLSLLRSRKDFKVLTDFLNVMSITLVFMVLIEISGKSFIFLRSGKQVSNCVLESKNNTKDEDRSSVAFKKPDIYYIILDGYARNSTLRDVYGYDNTGFTNMLTNKGFFVAYKSHSNYTATNLSLSSSLNMEYLNYLEDREYAVPKDYSKILLVMVQNNKVQAFLKSKGYILISLASGYGITNKDRFADIYYSCEGWNNKLKRSLIKTSALVLFEGFFIGEDSRRILLFNFKKLEEIPRNKNAKFVFCHLVCPHPPFIFDNKGKPTCYTILGDISSWRDKKEYLNQLIYLNKRLEIIIDKILSQSEIPPIIVLQADHGSASLFSGRRWEHPTVSMIKERMDIFNAYYLPGRGKDLLYDSITPVNTFRLIFSYYFDADYKLLDDISYYSTYDAPFKLTDVKKLLKKE